MEKMWGMQKAGSVEWMYIRPSQHWALQLEGIDIILIFER